MRRSVRGTLGLSIVGVVVLCLAMMGSGAGAANPTNWWDPPLRPAPDSQINVTGEPFKGTDANGTCGASSRRTTTSSPTRASAAG